MTLRLGTDEQQAATGSTEWHLTRTTGWARRLARLSAAVSPGLRKVGPDGVRGDFPSGTGHAVPADATVALCGTSPEYLWDGPFDPRSRVVAACPRCVERLPPVR